MTVERGSWTATASAISRSLAGVFAGNEPTFICDSAIIRDLLSRQGLPAVATQEVPSPPPRNAVVIFTDLGCARRDYPSLHECLRDARVLVLPAYAFDGSEEAVLYTLEAIASADFGLAVKRSVAWRKLFSSLPSPLTFRHPGHGSAALKCDLRADGKLELRQEVQLSPGDWVAAGSYFEVTYEVLTSQPSTFCLDGVFPVSGILAAKAMDAFPGVESDHATATEYVREFGKAGGAMLTVEHNVPVELRYPDGQSGPRLTDILALGGADYDHNIIEFAVGTGARSGPHIDWRVNSFTNEGAYGLHIGIGDGISSVHIDFISAETVLTRE